MITSNHAIWLSGCAAAVLLIGSTISAILKLQIARGLPHADIDNLSARMRSWWVMVMVFGGALWAGAWATCTLFAVISLIALHEFMATRCASRVNQWITGLGICVICIACIPALLTLQIPGYVSRNVFLLAFLIIVTQASDVLQYVWGKVFGKHLIAPGISPSKTVEGFAGGISSATLLGASLWWITPFTPAQAAAIALLITLTGFVGGLVMSAQKRARGIKDWGTLIHGHGGMLDRLDSLWLPAPLFFLFVKYAWSGVQ